MSDRLSAVHNLPGDGSCVAPSNGHHSCSGSLAGVLSNLPFVPYAPAHHYIPGIYVLSEGNILRYIGASSRPGNRMRVHRKSIPFDIVWFCPMTERSEMFRIEKRLIRIYKPSHNVMFQWSSSTLIRRYDHAGITNNPPAGRSRRTGRLVYLKSGRRQRFIADIERLKRSIRECKNYYPRTLLQSELQRVAKKFVSYVENSGCTI